MIPLFDLRIDNVLMELRSHPERFRISNTDYKLVHLPTKVGFWIGIGRAGLCEPVVAKFSWIDDKRFRRAIAGWQEAERRRRIGYTFSPNELVAGPQPHQGAGS